MGLMAWIGNVMATLIDGLVLFALSMVWPRS